MAWLRLDDGFTANSKVAQLSDAQFRVWIRLLCHCARSHDPTVDSAAIRETSGLDKRNLRVFCALGLVDQVGSDPENLEVHDWAKYLPKDATNADRQARWRARQRNARNRPEGVTPTVTEPSRTRAGTRGVPSRPVLSASSTPTNYVDAAEDDPEPVAVAPGSTGTLPVAEPEGVLRSV